MVHNCSNLVQIDHESSCGKRHKTNNLVYLDTEFLSWRALFDDDGKDGSILASIVGIDRIVALVAMIGILLRVLHGIVIVFTTITLPFALVELS